jgi:hypothetical protein
MHPRLRYLERDMRIAFSGRHLGFRKSAPTHPQMSGTIAVDNRNAPLILNLARYHHDHSWQSATSCRRADIVVAQTITSVEIIRGNLINVWLRPLI